MSKNYQIQNIYSILIMNKQSFQLSTKPTNFNQQQQPIQLNYQSFHELSSQIKQHQTKINNMIQILNRFNKNFNTIDQKIYMLINKIEKSTPKQSNTSKKHLHSKETCQQKTKSQTQTRARNSYLSQENYTNKPYHRRYNNRNYEFNRKYNYDYNRKIKYRQKNRTKIKYVQKVKFPQKENNQLHKRQNKHIQKKVDLFIKNIPDDQKIMKLLQATKVANQLKILLKQFRINQQASEELYQIILQGLQIQAIKRDNIIEYIKNFQSSPPEIALSKIIQSLQPFFNNQQ